LSFSQDQHLLPNHHELTITRPLTMRRTDPRIMRTGTTPASITAARTTLTRAGGSAPRSARRFLLRSDGRGMASF